MFIDTSVSIARLLSGQRMRAQIEKTAGQYWRCSGLVSRQEFKRRVLKDAEYLLRLLGERGGYSETLRYLNRNRGFPHQARRASICIEIMTGVHGADDAEQTDRLRAKLQRLLLTGLDQYEQWLDVPRIPNGSDCECGRGTVTPLIDRLGRRGRSYDFGPDRCNAHAPGRCGIVAFLVAQTEYREAIFAYLRTLPAEDKTKELKRAEEFLEAVATDPATAVAKNPCLTVGDLVIALESAAAAVGVVYTLNGKESQHLCRSLNQAMIVRPVDPTASDIECPADQHSSWPRFGRE